MLLRLSCTLFYIYFYHQFYYIMLKLLIVVIKKFYIINNHRTVTGHVLPKTSKLVLLRLGAYLHVYFNASVWLPKKGNLGSVRGVARYKRRGGGGGSASKRLGTYPEIRQGERHYVFFITPCLMRKSLKGRATAPFHSPRVFLSLSAMD